MKSKLVIALLFFYLLASTEFHQVLRLPLLVEHYAEHREQVSDITFWEFLVMHYENDVPHDQQDMSLPFKDCHHSLTAQAIAIPCPKITLNHPLPISIEKLLITDLTSMHSSYLQEIFQPPKS